MNDIQLFLHGLDQDDYEEIDGGSYSDEDESLFDELLDSVDINDADSLQRLEDLLNDLLKELE